MAILPALVLAVLILYREKGTKSHKMFGRVWVLLMLVSAISSFFIKSEGQFSWIHILSVVSISSVCVGVLAIRKNLRKLHSICMISAYAGAIVAGVVATLTPGRFVYEFMFGGG